MAVPIDHSLGWVEFEGHQYAWDCDCWHERAEKVIQFINGHGHEIASFLKRKKERQVASADALPTIEGVV